MSMALDERQIEDLRQKALAIELTIMQMIFTLYEGAGGVRPPAPPPIKELRDRAPPPGK